MLPEQKEVALLVAVAAQRLTDHIVVGVWVIPGLRRQRSQSEVGGRASPRDLPNTCVPAARLTWHRAREETVAIVPLPPPHKKEPVGRAEAPSRKKGFTKLLLFFP